MMKKRIFALFSLTLACLLVLSGCGGCGHEWQEADCLNAKICTKCQEVEGEALGHDWQAATCEVPETCARCGETRGEKLEHVYGEWIIGEENMTRSCKNCSAEETAEIDRELYWKQMVEGHWDFGALRDDSGMWYPKDFQTDYLLTNLHIDFENGCWWRSGEDSFEITPEFVDYEETEDSDMYVFNIEFKEDNDILTLIYVDSFDQIALYLDSSTYLFTRNRELEEVMTGLWANVQDGTFTALELKEDRTFTAEVAGQSYSGTWHLRSVNYYTFGNDTETVYREAGLDLLFEKNGAPTVKSHTLSLGQESDDLGSSIIWDGFYLCLESDSARVTKMDAEMLEQMKKAGEEGPKRILGEWNSTSVSTYNYSTSENVTNPVYDYTVTFNEDGTVTAKLDQEYTGTWTFSEARPNGTVITYNYKMELVGVQNRIYVSTYRDNELNFTISDDNIAYGYNFLKLTPEQKAQLAAEDEKAKTAIVGHWTSYSISQDGNTETNTGYTVDFNEDGTVTTNLEEGKTGTWKLESVDLSAKFYQYDVTLEGYSGRVITFLHNAEELSIGLHENSVSRSIYFAQMSPEERKTIEEAPKRILGTWSSTEITHYNKQSGKEEVVRQEAHTLTVKEDSTFTSTLPGMSSGTWRFWKLEEQGPGYIFQCDDGSSLYYLTEKETLAAWFQEGDLYLNIKMTKK